MLAIARPNPLPSGKRSAGMLRRIRTSSSKAKANPRRRSNGMSLREALAKKSAKKNPSRRRPSRSNGVARSNSKKPTLKQVLAQHNARRNGDLLDRKSLMSDIDRRTSAYETAVKKAKKDPSRINKRIVERQRKLLQAMKKDIDSALVSTRRGKSSTRKTSSRKSTARKSTARKSTARKSTSRKSTAKRAVKSKSGVANTTAAYKALRARSTKSRYTKAFNAAFKKAKRSGKSVASAQRSAISAGKKAVSKRSSARKNPSSALTAIAKNAKALSNPRKKKSTRKSSSKKRSTAKRSSSKKISATSSAFYKKLRSSAKKKKFVTEFNKAYKVNARKRGVSNAQAGARAALTAYSKVRSSSTRKNPASCVGSVARAAISNPRKKKRTTRKSSKKRTTRKSSSRRGASLESMARKSSLYKKLRTSSLKGVFVREFKKAYTKTRRKAKSDAQAAARAALSAYGKATKGNTRKNPLGLIRAEATANPRRKSSRRKSTRKSTRRSSSSSRARAKRVKRGMSKSAARVLKNYGAYTYTVTINGKEVRLKANKSSKEYKAAKKGGLRALKMTKLKAKKNTPVSLNLRTVYKVVDGKPTRKDFQRAINAWAGAIDGGKIRGVSKRDISRARMNPKHVRKHTVQAISNPAPMSSALAMRMHAHSNPRSGMDKVKLGGIGLGAFASSLYLSNYVSSLLGAGMLLDVKPSDVADKKLNYIAQEGIPVLAASLVGGYGLYKKFVKKSAVPDNYVALCGGLLAGSVTSLLSRTLLTKMGKFLGLKHVAEAGGDRLTFADAPKATAAGQYLLDNQSSSLGGLDMSDKRLFGNHHHHGMGRFVTVPTASQLNGLAREDLMATEMGTYIQDPTHTGRYVSVPTTSQLNGVYQHADGSIAGMEYARPHGMRNNPIAPGRVPAANQVSSVGANTQMVPNRGSMIPAGTYDMNADLATLREDMEIYEPLNQEEMDAEGLTEVYANGHQLRIIRATPDVARQVVEANFGSIVGPSRVVSGAILVLANTWDHPQNTALTNHLRLGRAPEVPKGASFPYAGGVFSRVAFSSLFPSVNNSASFQEFGVKI